MGTPEYAAVILQDLIAVDTLDIVQVVTQPDRPVGRKKVLTPPPVKTVATQAGLPLAQPERLADITTSLQALKPDLVVVAAYGQILPPEILAIAPCYNLHASLLPLHRGAAPVQAALLGGETVTGMTLMQMEKGLDTGPMLSFNLIPTAGHDAASLTEALQRSGAPLLLSTLGRLGAISPLMQHSCDANLVRKVKKQDGAIDFNRSSSEVFNRFRAYTPWPGIFLKSALAITALSLGRASGGFNPGEIVAIHQGAIEVGTLKGTVWIERLQAPSKKPVSAVDYLNGKRLSVGDLLV
jgi:methionyl-tRNA formyltransferase